MSGIHLVKKGREHRKMDIQRDFTVASPAEFVTRFGGDRVIDKVGLLCVCVCVEIHVAALGLLHYLISFEIRVTIG